MLNDDEIVEIAQQIEGEMPPQVDEQGNPIPGQEMTDQGQMGQPQQGILLAPEDQEQPPPKFRAQPNEMEFL